MKILKIMGVAAGLTAAAGIGVSYYVKDDVAKFGRMLDAQSNVIKLTGTGNFNKINNDIEKKTSGFFKLPFRQTLKTDAWEKVDAKIRQEHEFKVSRQAGIDSTQEAMNKLIKEKVQAAVDSVKKAQNAVVKKAKALGKKGTKHAKNAKITNKKHTTTAHKTIHKAAKKLVKQTSKHLKK